MIEMGRLRFGEHANSLIVSKPKATKPIAPCTAVCPQGTDVRTILNTIAQAEKRGQSRDESFAEAWRLVTDKNPLPAICGRVCPHQCEGECNRLEKDCAVGINSIERFLGDWAISHDLKHNKLTEESQPEKIAIIGSGPAGLSCAYHLVRRGYKVTIFEAFPEAGGMLRYGIPTYRLPREVIEAEIQKILDLGVELRTNVTVGRDVSIEEIKRDYDSVFLGIGAQTSVKLHTPGEETGGIYSGLEFLRLVNSGERVDAGKEVVVVGGGNTAIDAARVALRLDAKVTILYRRTRAEMPANAEEIKDAEEEGITIVYLAAPLEIHSEDGRIAQVVCQRMALGEPDESGRRKPIPIKDDTFTLSADTLITAVSQQPDWKDLEDLRAPLVWAPMDNGGYTERNGIYAGGDVEGIGIVAEALIQGKHAAEAMHTRFRGLDVPPEPVPEVVRPDRLNLHVLEPSERHDIPKLPVGKRFTEPWAEINGTLTEDDVIAEAKRCINCGESFVKPAKKPLIPILRRVSQIGVGTLLFNSYWGVLQTKMVYGGPLRNVCVPGLNCHSCPTALMGCPIGMMQHFSATHRIPWFLIGFLGIIGLVSGRFTCGWLCPWGLLQDVLHRFKKLTVRIPKLLIYFKYAVLVGVVIILPYFTYEHWFSKLCPNGALIAGIPWVLWNPVDPEIGITALDPAEVGTMFTIKMIILGAFLLLFLVIKRPFCRTVCPLGAIYALFNRISLVSLKVKGTCTDCAQCPAICPTDLEVRTQVNSEGCIKCLECTQCEHVKFSWNWPWKKREPKVPAEFLRAMQDAKASSYTQSCQGSCVGGATSAS